MFPAGQACNPLPAAIKSHLRCLSLLRWLPSHLRLRRCGSWLTSVVTGLPLAGPLLRPHTCSWPSAGWSCIPIQIETMVTSLFQSLGWVHSGCAISLIVWLLYALVLTLNNREKASLEIIGVAFEILSLLCLLVLLWAFIILRVSYDAETKSYNSMIGSEIMKHEEFWFTVRRVRVKITAPSDHASVIKFDSGIKAGLFGRISSSPFSEWHAFGTILEGKKEHMRLAAAVGDFIESLLTNPLSHLWVRQVHFTGCQILIRGHILFLLVRIHNYMHLF
ncbi:PREDICTED: uncharacterized protein LOC109227600 [Nicotiana attenuata]|uniref:uncharacterized protein LOC109227600 n=1 Tax=Nicotiana attenuata TaxID=49451 RepID=UPI0009058E9C|nr:PREDICTED: uncharacterized protein LOC109227600 [Nicotiana attenuata]